MGKVSLKKEMNVSDLLRSNNTKGQTKSKNTIPTVDSLKSLADKVHNYKVELKNIEGQYELAETELLRGLRPIYEKYGMTGQFSKSFNVEGSETQGVQVSYMDKFSQIEIDSKKDLKNEMGVYFEEKRNITLKESDDETIQLLIKKLGEQEFTRIFKIEVSIIAKKDMDRNQFSLSQKAKEFLRQAKASVKLLGSKE